MTRNSRMRAYRVLPELIEDLLTGKIQIVPLPDGVKVERYAVEWQTNSAILILSHSDWEEVQPGRMIDIHELLGTYGTSINGDTD